MNESAEHRTNHSVSNWTAEPSLLESPAGAALFNVNQRRPDASTDTRADAAQQLLPRLNVLI
jgi:hypothetical protein